MKKSDFYYDLPQELIAQTPALRRDASRLLVLNKDTGATEHRHFSDILEYLKPGDCLVVNDTRVIPARLFGTKVPTGASCEVLLLKDEGEDRWQALVNPGRRLREGAEISFGDGKLRCTVEAILPDGVRRVKFSYEGIFLEILDELGMTPLPPYIKAAPDDKERYQTVYGHNNGSAAAHTAGLHFTDELLAKVREMGIKVIPVTLHIGLGTFRPVKEEEITNHIMHSEFYHVTEESAAAINEVKKAGGRVIAVGTTSCRTLETVTGEDHIVRAGSGNTDIFIYPGYSFKCIDALITNFHLPESTLVMLVSALAGRENVLNAYKEAVSLKYRFFSFGDAMFIR